MISSSAGVQISHGSSGPLMNVEVVHPGPSQRQRRGRKDARVSVIFQEGRNLPSKSKI